MVAPLKPDAGWDAVKGFAKSIADSMAGDSPEKYVTVASGGMVLQVPCALDPAKLAKGLGASYVK